MAAIIGITYDHPWPTARIGRPIGMHALINCGRMRPTVDLLILSADLLVHNRLIVLLPIKAGDGYRGFGRQYLSRERQNQRGYLDVILRFKTSHRVALQNQPAKLFLLDAARTRVPFLCRGGFYRPARWF